MNLYLRDKTGALQRSENFPIASMAIGNYVANIFYVPDGEFDSIMLELGQEYTKPDPADDTKTIDNQVVACYSESKKVDCFLRPDRLRNKDREDFRIVKSLKAKGIILDAIKKN